MKKFLYSLIALAGLLTAASCQPDKLVGGKDGGDGQAANISISVSLGPQTKAFADGTKADKLFAGLYEIGNGPTYTHITHTAEAIAIDNEMRATVTFNGQIHRGNSYRLVFWAQKEGAPYFIDWATAATTGPTVTVTTYSGNTNLANDDTRDAFFGFYDAENVQGNVEVTEQNAIQLKRPFAQVNVLVPIANITTPAGAVASTMTVAQAPTVLNLATKATSVPQNWAFASNAIDEDPFAAYAPNDPNDPATHKYVAMNYVLVDQLAADARYDVGFTVSASAGVQTSGDKAVANVPLKPNGRTNIVGNVFADDFNISVPIIVSPGAGTEQELTTVTVAVGGMDEANAISLTDAYNSGTPLDIDVAVNHPITLEADKPEITVTPASVATAEWVLGTGLRVTPLVENGKAVITLVFPAVTKTAFAAATAQIYIKVGNGQNTAATPTFSPGAGEVAQGTPVTITSTTEGASIYYTTNGDEPTNASTLYEDPVVINSACTIKAIAIADGFANSAVAEAAYTLAPKPAQTLTVKVGDDTVGATLDKTYGDAGFSLTVTGNEGGLTYESASPSVATISNGGAISIVGAGSSVITVTADETASFAETSKVFTLFVAKKAATLTLGNNSATVTAGETTNVTCSYVSDGVISVVSSDENKATAVVENGNVVITGVAAGPATLTVSIAEGSNYAALASSQTIDVTVNPVPKTDRNLAFSAASAEVTIGANNNVFPTLSGNKIDDVIYSIENANPAGCVTINASTGAVTLNEAGTATVKATGEETTEYNSDVASYTLTVNPAQIQQVATPTFSVAAGTYNSAQSVELECATGGATIYYTTDGSTPTNASTEYTDAIAVSTTTTIKAIAVKNGMTDSEVATAAYTITGGGNPVITALYTADFEGASEHRTEGNNSFTENEYTVSGVLWSLEKADCVTSGGPLDGTANIMARIAKNTTNTASATTGNLVSSSNNITEVTFLSSLGSNVTLTVSYSIDGGANWVVATPVSDQEVGQNGYSFTLTSVESNQFSLKFVYTVTSSTGSHRDSKLDNVIVYGY